MGDAERGCGGAGPLAGEVKVRRRTVENPLSERDRARAPLRSTYASSARIHIRDSLVITA